MKKHQKLSIQKFFFLMTLLMTLIGGLLITSCSKKKVTIEGAGASFPFPFYSQIFNQYFKETEVRVNYQSIGSGGGVKQITERTVDFGATDAFIDDKKLSEINDATGNKLLHIPTVLGGVSITYNLPIGGSVNLDGETIAEIFMGKIKKWNNPRIAALNPSIAFPNLEIIVVRRSDGSGTTSALSSYLASQNMEWKNTVGVGKSLEWFEGSVGAKGNEGVTGQIQNTPNSIGYVSLNYAIKNNLPVVAVKNAYGNFIIPTVESVSLSADTDLPDDTRIDLTVLAGGENSYPISTFTWLVFYQEQKYNDRDQDAAKELQKLLYWVVDQEAQSQAEPLLYAPLPPASVEKARKIISSMTYAGKTLE